MASPKVDPALWWERQSPVPRAYMRTDTEQLETV